MATLHSGSAHIPADAVNTLAKLINSRSDAIEKMVENVRVELKMINDQIRRIERRMEKNEQSVLKIMHRVSDAERYGRGWNRRLFGIPESEGEDVSTRVINVRQEVMPAEEDKLADAVDVAHRVGRTSQNDPRPRGIILRFASSLLNKREKLIMNEVDFHQQDKTECLLLEDKLETKPFGVYRQQDVVRDPSTVLPPDIQPVLVIKEEIPLEWGSCQDQQHSEPVHIKQEEESWTSQERQQLRGQEGTDATKFPFTVVVKSEDGEEESQSQPQVRAQDKRKTDPLKSNSVKQMKMDNREPEPTKNPDLSCNSQPNTDEKASDSSETEDSADDGQEHWSDPVDSQAGVHKGEKPFHCDACGKSFKHQCELKRHKIVHTGEKPYVCRVCNKRFSQQGNLKRHMNFHTGEKPFGCTVCGYRFSENILLKKHMRVHTGENPNHCDSCGKDFKYPSDLKKHLRVHTKEALFHCGVCGKSFKYRCDLMKHMRGHTGKTPVQRSVCTKRFTQKSSLKKHMNVHTQDVQLGCDDTS